MPEKYPIKIINAASKEIDQLLNLIADDLRIAVSRYKIVYKEPFWKYNKLLYRAVNESIKKLTKNNLLIIKKSVTNGWNLSNKGIDNIIADYLKKQDANKLLESNAFKNVANGKLLGVAVPEDWVSYNEPQLKAFLNRTVNGHTLSGRVWKTSLEAKKMIKETLKSGILDGQSANEMSRVLRQALKNPNALFRRVRDKETGELKLSKPAQKYNPGRGVYRSAYKNARRLTATETNMAYRFAEFERYQKIPFVTGYEVRLSNVHPEWDICDSMVGTYPKTFAFIGWHPHCICYSTSVMLNDENFKDYLNTGKISNEKYVKQIPKQAKTYIKDNREKIDNLKNPPYWLRQNEGIIKDQTY